MQNSFATKFLIAVSAIALATGCAVSPTRTASLPASVPMTLAKVGDSTQSREMNDREMDGIAGGITGTFDMTDSGDMMLNDASVQSISLTEQAQQGMSSLVNILSINSTIQVMLNLNVNINSTVGTVNQGNTGTQNGLP
jgi:hypothetical protein